MHALDQALRHALGWLAERGPDLEALLRELVEISSHTSDKAGADEVAAHLVGAARAISGGVLEGSVHLSPRATMAITSRWFPRPARPPGRCSSSAIMTPCSRATSSTASVKTGRSRGPGVLDMKGGLAVIAFALGP